MAVSSARGHRGARRRALVAACLEGDEARAASLATAGGLAYASVKLALARWTRRQAPGVGRRRVRLNALAPGNTHTPLTEVTLADPEIGPLMEAVPVPVGRWADPDEIAAAAEWMLGGDSSFLLGTVLFVDGGTDAFVRPDTF